VSEAVKFFSKDWLMGPMRSSSERVQLHIFLAVIENTGIIDGKIVNLRDAARNDAGYRNRFNLSPELRKEEERKFEQRVKEYKEKYAFIKSAQFKEQDGKTIIDLPGISRDSEQVQTIRTLVQNMSKDALGEATEFDLKNYQTSLFGRLFMTFKNWIPDQAEVRWGEFRPNSAHESYEYGRFRMFYRALQGNLWRSAFSLIPAPYITGKATNFIFGNEGVVKRAKEVYQEKLQEERKLGRYNPETFISEDEFIEKFIQGVEATSADIRALIFMNLLLFVGIAAPDGDDDKETKAYKTLIRRQVNKLIDEVGFFYSPKNGIDIAGGGLPLFSLVRDTYYLAEDVNSEFFGFTIKELGFDEKGEKLQKNAKPVKRLFKVAPALKEILTWLPVLDGDAADDWGVKLTDQRAR